EIVGGAVLFARAKRVAIAAAHAHGGTSHRGQVGHELLVDSAGQHHEGHIARFRIGDAQAVDELALLAQLFEGAGQRHASSMYDPDAVVLGPRGDGAGAVVTNILVVERGASDFDDHFQFSPSLSSQPNIRFRFCTAWPAAPFKRLSRHETSTRRLPSGASVMPISQKLVRSENWICGNCGCANTRT